MSQNETVIYGDKGGSNPRNLDPREAKQSSSHAPYLVSSPFISPIPLSLLATFVELQKAPPGVCGTGWNEQFVPELVPKSCAFHDNLYSQPGVPRIFADYAFLAASLHESKNLSVALGYFLMVRVFGGPAYSEAQREAQQPQRLP